MKIEMNTVYNFPTEKHGDDFLNQADMQGIRWAWGNCATDFRKWNNEKHCIRTGVNNLAGHDSKKYYENRYPELPIIEWQIGFTKADMQIGQIYKTRDGEVHQWTRSDVQDVRWHNEYNRPLNDDIMEVYPLNLTPVWKRPEPKYRAKTELTKEQAEKLGLEFCEVVE